MQDVITPKATRRSTRLRVEISVSVTSLDRRRAFAETCTLLVVSAQGCGFRSTQALPLETPIMLNGLPGGSSVTARVASCLPLGSSGQFLIGAALYTHGNVWGIANPPEDWKSAAKDTPSSPASSAAAPQTPALTVNKQAWPYNLFPTGNETHSGRK